MAWIAEINCEDAKLNRQPTDVVAFVKIDTHNSIPIVQIDTRGSSDRENPGKQSQTIQFGKDSARKLFDIFKKTYGFE